MTQAKTPAPASLQGEGNIEAARRYDKAAHEFVAARKVGKAQPVVGSWFGFPGDFLSMDVDGQVRQRA